MARWVRWIGLAVVLVAAAVLSFDALWALAHDVGIPDHLGWLLPISVDAGAAVSCAVWLGRDSADDAARFAGRMTWALLATTVLGNAGLLGMHAYGITAPWWVAALVGTIPPAVVGATVHLVVLLTRPPAPQTLGELTTGRGRGVGEPAAPQLQDVLQVAPSLGATATPESRTPSPEPMDAYTPPATSSPPVDVPRQDLHPVETAPTIATASLDEDETARQIPTRAPLALAPQPIDEPEDGSPEERAWALALAGKGRPTIMRETGLSDAAARRIAAEAKARA